MDSITHALLIAATLMAIGAPDLIPFGILGAVIPDVDVLFSLFSSKRPSLYIFVHGGAAHSIAGAVCMGLIAFGALSLFVAAFGEMLFFSPLVTFTVISFAAVIVGALSHVAIDYLATPGIPLFWPRNETKYTLGVFAGPSVVMMVISWTFILLLMAGLIMSSGLVIYGAVFLVYLWFSFVIRAWAAGTIPGSTYPTINPFRWLAIEKLHDSWTMKYINILSRSETGARTWPTNRGVTTDEMKRMSGLDAVRRVLYHSIFTIASRMDNGVIEIQDPLRVDGIVRYPPFYARVVLIQKNGIDWEVLPDIGRAT